MSHSAILEELDRIIGESRIAAPAGWLNPVVEAEGEDKTKEAIKALSDTDYKDTDAHFKMVQLLKGLAAADDKLSEKFLSAVSDALTAAAKKVMGESQEVWQTPVVEQDDHEIPGADENEDGEEAEPQAGLVKDVEDAMDVIQDVSQAFTDPDERELAVDTVTALDASAKAMNKNAGSEGGTGVDVASPAQTEGVQQGEVEGVPELVAQTKAVMAHLNKFQDIEQAFQDPQEREELKKKLDALSRAVDGVAGAGDLA